MRITQHKGPHTATKEGSEDLTNLGGPSAVPTNPISIAGAPNRGVYSSNVCVQINKNKNLYVED